MKKIVLDASVVLKWYLEDETQGIAALSLLNDFAWVKTLNVDE